MQKNIFDTVHSHFPSFKDGINIKKKTLRKPYKTIVVRCWFSCSKKYHFIIFRWRTGVKHSLIVKSFEDRTNASRSVPRSWSNQRYDCRPLSNYLCSAQKSNSEHFLYICLFTPGHNLNIYSSIYKKKNGKTNRSQYKIC